MTDRPKQVGVWVSPERLALVRAVVEACGMSITHAGCPDASQTRRVAGELHAAAEDDLRRLMVDPSGTAGPGLVLVADLSAESVVDARTVAQAAARGGRVATLEPMPASAMAMAEGGWLEGVQAGAWAGRRFIGSLRGGRVMREAAEVLEHFRDPAAVWVQSACGPHEGSLGARLFDALDAVQALAGEAESVSASYTPALAGGASTPGESLVGLAGTMTVTLRLAGGRTAGVWASDRGASWRRSVTVLSGRGRLTLTDEGLEWRDATGAVVDASAGSEAAAWPAAAVLAESLGRFADPASPAEAPGDLAGVMAVTQAALLSARTGQSESPATIRRMVGMA